MPDYMGSILVFGIIITIFLSSWNSVISSQEHSGLEDTMTIQAEQTTTFLVSTPGYPGDWEEDGVDVQIPGFADPDHMVQGEKLREFRQLTYPEQKKLLQAPDYNMSIENETHILELDGQKLAFGKSYEDADTIIPVTRRVQVNLSGEFKTAELKYVVWK